MQPLAGITVVSVEQAVAELRKQRGRQFDPRVVDTFLQVLAEQQWRRMGSGEWIRG